MPLASIVVSIIRFYGFVIIAYVLMSWFPISGAFLEIYTALGRIVEPYVGIFRRFIPPIGMIDISAWVAILVLYYVITPLLLVLLGVLGL